MIRKIEIENFKTLSKVSLELGRLNIIVGENGSGKSNLLEAIALGIAGAKNKLDKQDLSARGIRLPDSKFMKSGFAESNSEQPISIKFTEDSTNQPIEVVLEHDGSTYSSWRNVFIEEQEKIVSKLMGSLFSVDKIIEDEDVFSHFDEDSRQYMENLKKSFFSWLPIDTDVSEFASVIDMRDFSKMLIASNSKKISDFIIYSPEETTLRRFDKQGQIEPLGSKGEGLLKLLTVFNDKRPEALDEVKGYLKMFGWFEDMRFNNKPFEKDFFFDIRDKYLDGNLGYFDQRSANEGFLFLVFYLCLFISKNTPATFAIDNIDNSLNPKLGAELIRILSDLGKKNGKQCILTTHNPAILDGLDLNDPEQKLFVLSRKRDGSTRISEVKTKPTTDTDSMKLSEMFMAGMLGGLPKSF